MDYKSCANSNRVRVALVGCNLHGLVLSYHRSEKHTTSGTFYHSQNREIHQSIETHFLDFATLSKSSFHFNMTTILKNICSVQLLLTAVHDVESLRIHRIRPEDHEKHTQEAMRQDPWLFEVPWASAATKARLAAQREKDAVTKVPAPLWSAGTSAVDGHVPGRDMTAGPFPDASFVEMQNPVTVRWKCSNCL